MSGINYSEKIPNNVNLSEDRTLQRALEQWQPNFINWWDDMGPEGSTDMDVYLRTAVSVDPQGWAQFGHVKMPDYRWGIFLNPAEQDRKIHFGDHKGEDAWQDVPGEYRANLRRIIVTQGDTEPASVEQQRHPDGDARIRHIEDRPDSKVKKIDDITQPHAIDQIADGTAEHQRLSRRSGGAARGASRASRAEIAPRAVASDVGHRGLGRGGGV
mgnify:CR=1 FL=1